MKVGYVLLKPYRPGAKSTAYLDEQQGESWIGVDKHTDEPVRVRWDGESCEWMEVEY